MRRNPNSEDFKALVQYLSRKWTDEEKAIDIVYSCWSALDSKELAHDILNDSTVSVVTKKEIAKELAGGFDSGVSGLSDEAVVEFARRIDPDEVIEDLLRGGWAEDAPFWSFVDLIDVQEEAGWLVHCSDSDWLELPLRGVSEIGRLGLTTYLSTAEKRSAGYIFGYTPRNFERYGHERWSRQCKYGRYIYLLFAPHVVVWHNGDEEYQAICWSEDIKRLVRVYESGGRLIVSGSDDEDVEFSSIEDVVEALDRGEL